MGVLSVTLVTALFVMQAAELPPPFPRPGTTKLLENDAVAVWDVSWLKQKYPLHTHRYDLVGISYTDGDRIITASADSTARQSSPNQLTKAAVTSTAAKISQMARSSSSTLR